MGKWTKEHLLHTGCDVKRQQRAFVIAAERRFPSAGDVGADLASVWPVYRRICGECPVTVLPGSVLTAGGRMGLGISDSFAAAGESHLDALGFYRDFLENERRTSNFEHPILMALRLIYSKKPTAVWGGPFGCKLMVEKAGLNDPAESNTEAWIRSRTS